MFRIDDVLTTNEKVIRKKIAGREDVLLFPFCDLHVGDPNSLIAEGKRFIKYIRDTPNAYLMFLGDNMNNAIKSSVSNVYHESMNPHEQKKLVIDLLEPVADRFLCFVPGNHENRTAREADAELVWDIADRLGRSEVYRRNIAFIDLAVGRDLKLKQANHYKIAGLHGTGGGKQPGSTLNNLITFGYAIEGLDMVICGHAHQRVAGWPARLSFPVNGDQMTQRTTQAYVAAAWQSWGGYAARGMYRPSALGPHPIRLCGRKKVHDLAPWQN